MAAASKLNGKMRVVVPTRNAAAEWPRLAAALLACTRPEQVVVVDAESTDSTVELAHAAGFTVYTAPRTRFDLVDTLATAAELLDDAGIIVLLAQDAVPASSHALRTLVAAFDDPKVGAAYGRQLPRPGAGSFEIHACRYYFPRTSDVRSLASRERLGLGVLSLSGAFSAYRRSALAATGGTTSEAALRETAIIAAEFLLAGWKLAYVAEASVVHSKPCSILGELRRCFDLGALHSRERWLADAFGSPGAELRRFVVSELKYLREENPGMIPVAMVRVVLRFVGYGLGRMQSRLTPPIKRVLSRHPEAWPEDL